MPGNTVKFTTLGTGKDNSLAMLVGGTPDPTPQYAISIRADVNNGSGKAINVGRISAVEPFYANDSRTYYSIREEELILNDNSNVGLILYIDQSGPMDPLAQYVTSVPARIFGGGKAPNDPTP